MRKFAILGYPLGHTLSPQIHKRLFELSGDNNSEYTIMEIPPEKLKESFESLKELNGFNITIPHKISIMEMLDEVDTTAKIYGACNVISCGEKTIGYNTDGFGFKKSIEVLGTDLKGDVLLLGCGGAGRMMAIETAIDGGNLTIATRNKFSADIQKVLEDIKKVNPKASVKCINLTEINRGYNLIINSTPLGMYPKIDGCAVEEHIIKQSNYIFDAVYNPSQTKLYKLAEKHGVKCQTGMAMLVWQAVKAHEIWDNARYRTEDIVELIKEMEALV